MHSLFKNLINIEDMGRENALRAAVRAVEEYIGLNPLVIRLLSEEDGTPREDGELDLFLP